MLVENITYYILGMLGLTWNVKIMWKMQKKMIFLFSCL